MITTHKPKFKAVIFDMDGVLTDSEPYYYEAINVMLGWSGLTLSEKEHEAILGFGVKETWEWLANRFTIPGDMDSILVQYDTEILRILKKKVTPATGLTALVAGFKHRHLRFGLASSSQRNWIDAVLEKLGLTKTFEAIASGDEVKHSKPNPEIYLLAARRLGVAPNECLVIEDSPTGVRAGKAAGMTVVAVHTPSTVGLDLSHADTVIESLERFDWSLVDRR